MLHVLEPVFFMLMTISSSVPLAVALKARWGTLHLAPDVEDLAWAAEPLPLLEPVEPVEPVEPEEEEPGVGGSARSVAAVACGQREAGSSDDEGEGGHLLDAHRYSWEAVSYRPLAPAERPWLFHRKRMPGDALR
jgi:hypothetical protein